MSDYEDGSDYRPDLGPPRPDSEDFEVPDPTTGFDRSAGQPATPPPPPLLPGSPPARTQDPSAVGALVLGLLAVVLSLFCGMLAIPAGIAAIVLGVRGRRRAQAVGQPAGLAVTGILLGGAGIVAAITFVVLAALLT